MYIFFFTHRLPSITQKLLGYLYKDLKKAHEILLYFFFYFLFDDLKNAKKWKSTLYPAMLYIMHVITPSGGGCAVPYLQSLPFLPFSREKG